MFERIGCRMVPWIRRACENVGNHIASPNLQLWWVWVPATSEGWYEGLCWPLCQTELSKSIWKQRFNHKPLVHLRERICTPSLCAFSRKKFQCWVRVPTTKRWILRIFSEWVDDNRTVLWLDCKPFHQVYTSNPSCHSFNRRSLLAHRLPHQQDMQWQWYPLVPATSSHVASHSTVWQVFFFKF